MSAKLLVIGDVIDDIIVVPEHAIRPNTDTNARIEKTLGGSAANVAAWAASSGVSVNFLGCVGRDDLARGIQVSESFIRMVFYFILGDLFFSLAQLPRDAARRPLSSLWSVGDSHDDRSWPAPPHPLLLCSTFMGGLGPLTLALVYFYLNCKKLDF